MPVKCLKRLGLASGLFFLALFWGLNGWFQSMGFPPCARILANWYSVSERGLVWSIWNISHQLGAIGARRPRRGAVGRSHHGGGGAVP